MFRGAAARKVTSELRWGWFSALPSAVPGGYLACVVVAYPRADQCRVRWPGSRVARRTGARGGPSRSAAGCRNCSRSACGRGRVRAIWATD